MITELKKIIMHHVWHINSRGKFLMQKYYAVVQHKNTIEKNVLLFNAFGISNMLLSMSKIKTDARVQRYSFLSL